MLHRIFIAISLPDNIKKALIREQDRITAMFSSKCPVSWTRKENFHITVSFLGSVSNDELMDVLKAAREVADRHNSFDLSLKKISYGPHEPEPAQVPRMIWVSGEKSAALAALRDDLENTLSGEKKFDFSKEERVLSPHVTLGRVMAWEFKAIEKEERPDISSDISLDLGVSSIDVMESELKRSGARYNLLGSFPLSPK